GEALYASLKQARDDLRAAQARLRAAKITEEDVRASAKAIDAVAHRASIGGELEPRAVADAAPRAAIPAAEIRVGLRVYVPRLRAEADIVEVLAGGQLRVAAGALKLATSIAEVRALHAAPATSAERRGRGAPPSGKRVPFDAASDPDVPIQTSEN